MNYVKDMLIKEGLPDEFIEWAMLYYPIMCEKYGVENTHRFFRDYKLVPRTEQGSDLGNCHRGKKIIKFDWLYNGNFTAANCVFMHEADHAMGMLCAYDFDNMLMEGVYHNEAFLVKLEEALVSELQNIISYGEVNYSYHTINTFDDEEWHNNDFKSQDYRYTVHTVYYELLNILLGTKSDLFYKNKYSNDREEKRKTLNEGIEYLRNILSKEGFLVLKDSVATLILNYSYKGCADTYSVRLENARDRKGYEEATMKEFPKTFSYCKERKLLNKKIFDAVDDLCELTIDVLIRRLSDNNYDSFLAIKEACKYIVQVDNNSDRLKKKTYELKEILLKKMEPIIKNFDVTGLENAGFSKDEQIDIITKIVSLSNYNNPNSRITFGDDLSFSFGDSSEKFYVVTKNIYNNEPTFGREIVIKSDKYEHLRNFKCSTKSK